MKTQFLRNGNWINADVMRRRRAEEKESVEAPEESKPVAKKVAKKAVAKKAVGKKGK